LALAGVLAPGGRAEVEGVQIWDWQKGQQISTLVYGNVNVFRLAFTPNSRYLLVVGNRTKLPLTQRRGYPQGPVEDRVILVWEMSSMQLAAVLAYPARK